MAELTPKYLPAPALDPFSLGKPLLYRRNGSGYVLYSIGPDGKDDGGRPIDSKTPGSSNPNERYFIKPESVGDVVAGTNIW